MRTFHFRIWSKRHTGPTENRVTVRDEHRAIELAMRHLKQTTEHLVIEVHDPDQGLTWMVRADGPEPMDQG